jgi:uncharacterized Fe-S center protein
VDGRGTGVDQQHFSGGFASSIARTRKKLRIGSVSKAQKRERAESAKRQTGEMTSRKCGAEAVMECMWEV